MRAFIRSNLIPTTIVIAGLAIFLVVAAVQQLIPPAILPTAPEFVLQFIPHANVLVSLLAITTIIRGWYWITNADIQRHRQSMLLATALFATFLVLYLYRIIHVGPTEFTGPTVIYHYLYLPILAIHITLAIICIPLVTYALLIALTYPHQKITDTPHPTIGRIAASLWLISYTLGITVYGFLHIAY